MGQRRRLLVDQRHVGIAGGGRRPSLLGVGDHGTGLPVRLEDIVNARREVQIVVNDQNFS